MATCLSPDDDLKACIVKLAAGNIGAATALVAISTSAPVVDPDSALGAFGPVLDFDDMGFKAPMIWVLYKDVCGQSGWRVNLLLRARQLGLVSDDMLRRWATRPPDGLLPPDFKALFGLVRAELPNFLDEPPWAVNKTIL